MTGRPGVKRVARVGAAVVALAGAAFGGPAAAVAGAAAAAPAAAQAGAAPTVPTHAGAAPTVASHAGAAPTVASRPAARAAAARAQSLPGYPRTTVSDFGVGSVLGGITSAVNPAGAALGLGASALEGNPACGTAGVLSAGAASSCGQLSTGHSLLSAGGQLLSGNLGGAIGTVVGGAAGMMASTASAGILAAIGGWVVGGAAGVLGATASALGASTSPKLGSTWFSSTYWRMAAIAAVLTLPFLFAAAVQALLRSDLALLARAAFGYLPLAMLVIAIAAPLTTLLLAACDQLCSMISSAAGNESAHFLARAGVDATALTALAVSPFLAFLVGLFIIGAAFTLWIELLLREAAVYVIVLMLPLAFAAFVWPARRIWAVRAMELLVALILSKFAIVAVLSLGGAAISAGGDSVTGLMAGAVLIMLAAFTPWALVRLVPLAELASGAAGSLRGELRSASASAPTPTGLTRMADEWMGRITSSMKRDAEPGPDQVAPASPRLAGPPSAPSPIAPSTLGATAAEPSTPSPGPPAAHEADEGPASDSFADSWRTAPILELGGENHGSTPVSPTPDAT